MSHLLRKIVVAVLAGASVWVLMWPRLMSWPDYSLYAVSAWGMLIIALIIQGWALDSMEVELNQPRGLSAGDLARGEAPSTPHHPPSKTTGVE